MERPDIAFRDVFPTPGFYMPKSPAIWTQQSLDSLRDTTSLTTSVPLPFVKTAAAIYGIPLTNDNAITPPPPESAGMRAAVASLPATLEDWDRMYSSVAATQPSDYLQRLWERRLRLARSLYGFRPETKDKKPEDGDIDDTDEESIDDGSSSQASKASTLPPSARVYSILLLPLLQSLSTLAMDTYIPMLDALGPLLDEFTTQSLSVRFPLLF